MTSYPFHPGCGRHHAVGTCPLLAEDERDATLLDLLHEPLPGDDQATIQARFERFHEANPGIYDALVGLARDYKRRGYPRVGIAHLVEIVRWERRLETYDETSDFRLPNAYRSRYSRLIMELEPDLAGFLTTAALRAE